jgi:hypothetical protein
VKLKVPDALEEVKVAIVRNPLPPSPDADQLPVVVFPLVAMTLRTVVLKGPIVVVPTTARAAKLIEKASAALFEATLRFPEGLTLAALTVPV